MDRITAVRRALAAVFLAAMLLAPRAWAEAPPESSPPPAASPSDGEAAPSFQLEALVCSLLCGLCELFDDGEEGSSIDPFGGC